MLSLGAVRYQPDSNELKTESKANCYLLISSVFLKCAILGKQSALTDRRLLKVVIRCPFVSKLRLSFRLKSERDW